MEFITTGNYSFTFTISSKKVVYYRGNRRPYYLLPQIQQYDFLENQLQKINKFNHIKWVYEEHKEDKRLHVHGYVMNTSDEEMNDFRARFYDHPITIAVSGQIKLSNIQRTLIDINYFQIYMEKHQHEIIYYMRTIQDRKHYDALDGKPFNKKTLTIDININPHYLNSLDDVQESGYLGDEYLFGKQNKFTVEY